MAAPEGVTDEIRDTPDEADELGVLHGQRVPGARDIASDLSYPPSTILGMGVRILDTPAHQRPRERLRARGVDALSERELLALVLRSGCHGRSALDVADELLAEFGGLHGLARAHAEELARRPGVGEAKAAGLIAAFRLGHLSAHTRSEAVTLKSPADVAGIAQRESASSRRECVLVLVCDARNRLTRLVRVSEGSVDHSHVPVREVLNATLRYDGHGFAVAHNHPSGDPTPSKSDLRVTLELEEAARTVGLRFLDHVVVTTTEWQIAAETGRTDPLSSLQVSSPSECEQIVFAVGFRSMRPSSTSHSKNPRITETSRAMVAPAAPALWRELFHSARSLKTTSTPSTSRRPIRSSAPHGILGIGYHRTGERNDAYEVLKRRDEIGDLLVGSANFAWVQHFVHNLAPTGLAGFVLATQLASTNTFNRQA